MLKFTPVREVVQNAKIKLAEELSAKYDMAQIESDIALCIENNGLNGICTVVFTFDDLVLLQKNTNDVEVKCLREYCPMMYRYISIKLETLGYIIESRTREVESKQHKNNIKETLAMCIMWSVK